ncbi:MAG: hypothetical protein AAFX94_25590, partial [Myxococcota bacterium]
WYKGAPDDHELDQVPERSRARIIEISCNQAESGLDAHGMDEVYLKYIEENRRYFMDEVFRRSADVLPSDRIKDPKGGGASKVG